MPTSVVSLSSLALGSLGAECVCAWTAHPKQLRERNHLAVRWAALNTACRTEISARGSEEAVWDILKCKDTLTSVLKGWKDDPHKHLLFIAAIHLPVIPSIPEPYSYTQPQRQILTLFRQGQSRSKSCFLDQKQVLGCSMALALCIASLLPHVLSSHFVAMDNPPKPASSFHLPCSNTKLWTVQKLSWLHWEDLSKLQRENFILKSTFTYMWVTMVVKSLQSNNAVS